jgi:hypothetical protein
VILPIVALINKLRRIPEYPIFEYEVTLIDADGESLVCCHRCWTVTQHCSDPLAITEVHFFGDFNTDTLEFPVIFFLVGSLPLLLLRVINLSSQPSLSLKQDVEDGQFLLPMSASFGRALNRWRSEGNWIIVTDFSTTVLINAVDEKLQVTAAECEVRPPSPSTVPLRYLLASYIQKTLPRDYLALDTERLTITHGAPNNPHLPLPADEEIFANRHAHSDFDRYALANSQPLVEQFLRWKALMQARPKSVLVGTVLQAKCHGFQQHIPRQHRYPLESLPEDTLAHLRTAHRCSFPQFIQLFNRSQAFSVLLDEELTQPEGTGYARTFTCRIIAVDGQPPPSDDVPRKLCVKLFDDSAAFVPSLEKYAFWWSQSFYTAEDMIRNEIVVYNRLEHAWGSVIPHFYGAHSVSSS